MSNFDVIAFDADDTLWHTERLYNGVQERFIALLSAYHDPQWIEQALFQTETRNMAHYGYGVKAFALSMIETAVELTEGRVTGQDIHQILELARGMLDSKVDLLEPAASVVAGLSTGHRLMLVTKGDALEQEGKVARSGLAGFFQDVEVVSDKTAAIYARLLQRHTILPERFLMVGNSLRSDILPVLALGGQAVYIPYQITWAHEQAETPPQDQPGFYQIASLDQLPELIGRLEQDGSISGEIS